MIVNVDRITVLTYFAFFAFVVALAAAGPELNIAVIGACIAFLVLQILQKSSTALLSFWMVGVALFPPWISFYIAGYRLPVAALISVACVIVGLRNSHFKRSWIDSVVASLVAITFLNSMFLNTPLHIATQALLEWAACYAAGRILFAGADLVRICNRLGGALGWLSCLQFLTNFNLSETWPFSISAAGNRWATLQERGGGIRSELAFGHSIALGAVLVMLLAFGIAARGTLSAVLTVGIVLGVLSTFSRSAIAAAVITIVISIIRSRADSVKKAAAITLSGLAAYAVALQFLRVVTESANSVELTDSTSYREGLLSLFGTLGLSGLAPDGVPVDSGLTYRWANFYSIDNGVLFVGLYAGAIAMILYILPPVWILLKNGLKFWSNFSTLVLAQVPFIATVAPITQYQNFFWLFIGLGISEVAVRKAKTAASKCTPVEKLNAKVERTVRSRL